MPRRGLFRQAKAFGLFQSLRKEEKQKTALLPPAPSLATRAEQIYSTSRNDQIPIADATGHISQNFEGRDFIEHNMPGAFPSTQEPATRDVPIRRTISLRNSNIPITSASATERQQAIDSIMQRHSLQANPSRLGNLVRGVFSHRREPALSDHAPPPFPQSPVSWNDIRDILNASEKPPSTAAEEAQWWDAVRYRFDIPPPTPWQNSPPQFPQFPMGPPMTVIQTPHGPMYLNVPPTLPSPSGLPIDTPWTQWDAKQVATLFFLAGMKLTWNACTSMWEVLSLAWDHNIKDQMKIRDQQNEQMVLWAQLGYPMPPQQLPPQSGPGVPFGFPISGSQPTLPGSWIW
ncbi:hypothetical protein TWF694_000242 [Orbilia ellipsospora]|uniref:Uncharacterized protein n=1 Tax=Orbilia ellipsospora TaxID=2528407 RepID=A0AAV9XNG8_9PEZI